MGILHLVNSFLFFNFNTNFCKQRCREVGTLIVGNLKSKGVLKPPMSTRRGAFSPLFCLDDTNFILLSVFTLTETICLRIRTTALSKNVRCPLLVDVVVQK